ncbi:hypothetical protein VTG60DRAFT_7125 [Thermothelomyces hinnuleus]
MVVMVAAGAVVDDGRAQVEADAVGGSGGPRTAVVVVVVVILVVVVIGVVLVVGGARVNYKAVVGVVSIVARVLAAAAAGQKRVGRLFVVAAVVLAVAIVAVAALARGGHEMVAGRVGSGSCCSAMRCGPGHPAALRAFCASRRPVAKFLCLNSKARNSLQAGD